MEYEIFSYETKVWKTFRTLCSSFHLRMYTCHSRNLNLPSEESHFSSEESYFSSEESYFSLEESYFSLEEGYFSLEECYFSLEESYFSFRLFAVVYGVAFLPYRSSSLVTPLLAQGKAQMSSYADFALDSLDLQLEKCVGNS